jgi:hypothetical protein
MRRDFAGDELNRAFHLQVLRKDTFLKIEKKKTLDTIWRTLPHAVSPRLFLLQKYFPEKYAAVCNALKNIFPFIEGFVFKDMNDGETESPFPGQMPMLHVKDRNEKSLIPIQALSSGMRKVLLVVTDIVMLPPGIVYLLDEYENSLGTNAMNFLPTLLGDHGESNQFLVTSHHPYLINAIPVENWIVFHRTGLKISVRQGEELVESFGRSKQQSYIKLINDPFFTDGK